MEEDRVWGKKAGDRNNHKMEKGREKRKEERGTMTKVGEIREKGMTERKRGRKKIERRRTD
jgi:hypothetical protein